MKRTILVCLAVLVSGILFTLVSERETEAASYPNGTIIRAEGNPKVYVIHNDKKRWLRNEAIFNSYQYGWDNILVLSQSDVDAIPYNNLIRADGIKIFALNDLGYKRHIMNPDIFSSYALNWGDVADVNPTELAEYPDSNLIRLVGDPKIYYLDGVERTIKRWVSTLETFVLNNFNWETVQVINQTDFNTYSPGVEVVTIVGPTTPPSTSTVAYTCTDSDDGQNIYQKGTTTRYTNGGNPVSSTDTCDPYLQGQTNLLREYFCSSTNQIDAVNYTCPTGYTCSDGACVPETNPDLLRCFCQDGTQIEQCVNIDCGSGIQQDEVCVPLCQGKGGLSATGCSSDALVCT